MKNTYVMVRLKNGMEMHGETAKVLAWLEKQSETEKQHMFPVVFDVSPFTCAKDAHKAHKHWLE